MKYKIEALKNIFKKEGFTVAYASVSFGSGWVGGFGIILYNSLESFITAAKGMDIKVILFQVALSRGMIVYPFFVKEGFYHRLDDKIVESGKITEEVV